ncbi:MAG: 3-deoxy-D-manno-octulosonic acid transferase [Paludibacteraceae bacterium]|nr:3-deoxy-D-manno-octulosonic acid transferase [Paludibacteraceae bacterium]
MITNIYFGLLRFAALCGHEKAGKLVEGERKAMSHIASKLDSDAHYIWIHAASVGEFEQGRPIIERLKQERPELKILLTFFSPSGYEMRKDYPLADIVAYLPFATMKKARAFLDLVKPELAIFIKYEFWPAYLHELHKRQIPTYIIAAIFRRSQTFFKWYGRHYRKNLHLFTHLFVQNEKSRDLLARFHINNVTVCGDPRFDRVTAIARKAQQIPQIEQFVNGQPTLVVGSSWQPDEELIFRWHAEHPEIKLILVPHEIHQGRLHSIFQGLQGRFIRYTEATPSNLDSCNCMVVDAMGLLSSIYRYATVAYIGGGFGVGIHNTLEAATFGVPVVFGPHYDHFREARQLVKFKGGFSIKNYKELDRVLQQLFDNPKESGAIAGNYVRQNLGATDTIFNMLFK